MPIDEKELSANLGLNRRTVAELRDKILTEGEDFVRGKYRKIVITLPGVEKIKRHFFPEEYLPESLESDLLSGHVTNWKYRNRKIVQVDNQHIVRVKNADDWRPNINGLPCPITFKQVGGYFEASPIRPEKGWRRIQPRIR